MVLSPVFLGAEPNEIDEGPHAGTTSFIERIELGTAVMAALPVAQRRAATVYEETWFSWIGGHQPGDVFSYRVQSPVVIAELHHHCGVFLDYDTPQPFHVHTVLRTRMATTTAGPTSGSGATGPRRLTDAGALCAQAGRRRSAVPAGLALTAGT